MSWRRYQNELMVGISFLIMLIALGYKQGKISAQESQRVQIQSTIDEMNAIIEFKQIWANKNILKKILELKGVVAPSKVNWTQQKSKVTAHFTELNASELNQLGKKVMNLALELEKFEMTKRGELYDVELQCKW